MLNRRCSPSWMREPLNPNGVGNRRGSECLLEWRRRHHGPPRDTWFIEIYRSASQRHRRRSTRNHSNISRLRRTKTERQSNLCEVPWASVLDLDGGSRTGHARDALADRASQALYCDTRDRPVPPVRLALLSCTAGQELIVIPREDDLMFGFSIAASTKLGRCVRGLIWKTGRDTHTHHVRDVPVSAGHDPDIPVVDALAAPTAAAIAPPLVASTKRAPTGFIQRT